MTAAWGVLLPHADKIVLLALADNANDEGDCWPSIATLAAKCGMDRTTVLRAIKRLEAAQHISKHSSPGRSTNYRIHPSLSATSGFPPPVAQSDHTSGAAPLPVVDVRHPTSGRPPPPYRTVIEPSIEPSLNRQRARAKASKPEKPKSEEPPPPNLNVEAWHRWEQYRREIRKAIKPASKLAAQRKLAGFGVDQEAVVEQSIANGWQGLFELKSNGAASPPAYRPAKSADELEAEALARGENPWA